MQLLTSVTMMNEANKYAFSPRGLEFGVLTADGRLLLWNSLNSADEVKKEFVPSSHLTNRPTCLSWFMPPKTLTSQKSPVSKNKNKKKNQGRESVTQIESDVIGLGTNGGTLMLYSVLQGDVTSSIKVSDTPLNCLTWSLNGSEIYAGGNNGNIFQINVSNGSVTSTFTTGKFENIQSIALVTPSEKTLLVASNKISWIDLSTKSVLKAFMGHKSTVILLKVLQDKFLISASVDDLILNVWNLDSPTGDSLNTTLIANESVRAIDYVFKPESGEITISAVTHSGALKIFTHDFNGKGKKAIRPSATLQFAGEKNEKGKVPILPILDSVFLNETRLSISYGGTSKPIFEELDITTLRKTNVFLRNTETKVIFANANNHVSSLQVPDTSTNVVLPPSSSISGVKRKKSKEGNIESEKSLTMLERLKLLSKDNNPKATPPRTDSLLQLLLQGLHNQDRKILDSVLDRADEDLINNTVRKLPFEAIIPLLEELQHYIRGRGMVNQAHSKWLRSVLSHHAGYLMSSPSCEELLEPFEAMLRERTRTYIPLMQLKGQLELVTKQLVGKTDQSSSFVEKEALLIYHNDSEEELSDVLDDLLLPASDTDDNWDDGDDNEEEEEEEEEEPESDVEIVNGNDVDMESD